MAKRTLNRLTARSLARQLPPGRYADGGGLYLVVTPTGSRKWVFRYGLNGQQHDMGLGAVRDVPLAQAREAAATARSNLRSGKDPRYERQRTKTAGKAIPSFGEVADELIDSLAPSFRNEKHRAQWRSTLHTHANALRSKPVDAIDTENVLEVLKPLWQSRPETAGRLRGRIERVLDAAKAKGLRTGENPARWRGHLDALLPRRHKLNRGHHAALPWDALPAFMQQLRAAPDETARSLEFLILTAARTGEVVGMRWSELSNDLSTWTVPADRMKGAREHRVPLCESAKDILASRPRGKPDAFVFAGREQGKSQSNMAMAMLLRRLAAGMTVHGFRSTFRDWVGECTQFPREVAEAALAHVIGDETERAYRRGDALTKRRELMKAWADFCNGRSNVVPLAVAG